MSTLILGGGELGTAVINALQQDPSFDVTLLVRPASFSRYTSLQSSGVKLLGGDIAGDSTSQLAELFRGFDTVISCTGFITGKGTQIKITKAVLEAGVNRYIPWQFGVDYDAIGRGSAQDTFDEQLDVRDLLRQQNKTEWIIVSTGMFMSFLFQSFFGVVDLTTESKRVHALGSWENAVAVTAVEDIGRLVKEILLTRPNIKDEVVFVAGDVVSYKRLADVVEKTLERQVERSVLTVEALKDELQGDPENGIKKYRVLFAEGKGVSWPLHSTFNAARGIAVTNVDEFASKHLQKFR